MYLSSKMIDDFCRGGGKREALTGFASGIAHDINNVLTAIIGNISLALIDTPREGQLYEMLSEMEDASGMAKDLTRLLDDYSRVNIKFDSLSGLDGIVSDIVKNIPEERGVKYEIRSSSGIKPVKIVEKQIYEVLRNLLSNASLSMPAGGTIEIEIKNVSIAEGDRTAGAPGEYVMISVRDHGCGIPEKIITRIFDPYFTTRKKARGMGLAVAYSVVSNHKGFMTAETEEGAGSTFSVYLPAAVVEI